MRNDVAATTHALRVCMRTRGIFQIYNGTLSRPSRYPALKTTTPKGGTAMTAFVSQLSIVAAYAAMAFVGAIVLGVL